MQPPSFWTCLLPPPHSVSAICALLVRVAQVICVSSFGEQFSASWCRTRRTSAKRSLDEKLTNSKWMQMVLPYSQASRRGRCREIGIKRFILHVCMYINMHIFMCIYIYIHIIFMCMIVHTHIYVRLDIHQYIYIYLILIYTIHNIYWNTSIICIHWHMTKLRWSMPSASKECFPL